MVPAMACKRIPDVRRSQYFSVSVIGCDEYRRCGIISPPSGRASFTLSVRGFSSLRACAAAGCEDEPTTEARHGAFGGAHQARRGGEVGGRPQGGQLPEPPAGHRFVRCDGRGVQAAVRGCSRHEDPHHRGVWHRHRMRGGAAFRRAGGVREESPVHQPRRRDVFDAHSVVHARPRVRRHRGEEIPRAR